MSTFQGLPIHALLVHFIVVLVPLTAVLAILSAVWPAARERLVWLVLALAVVTAGLSPLSTNSGEWLQGHLGQSALIEKHAAMGDTIVYFTLALLLAAILLAIVHVRAGRGKPLSTALSATVAVFIVVASVATSVQVFRIGHSGAQSVWGDALETSPAAAADAE